MRSLMQVLDAFPDSLTALQDLNVCGTKINDEGLSVIGSLPAIHTLDLRGCGDVSAQAVESLSIPDLLADHENDGY